MTMAVLDPNILNPYVLLNPSAVSSVISLVVTAASAFLSFIISWYFYRILQVYSFWISFRTTNWLCIFRSFISV